MFGKIKNFKNIQEVNMCNINFYPFTSPLIFLSKITLLLHLLNSCRVWDWTQALTHLSNPFRNRSSSFSVGLLRSACVFVSIVSIIIIKILASHMMNNSWKKTSTKGEHTQAKKEKTRDLHKRSKHAMSHDLSEPIITRNLLEVYGRRRRSELRLSFACEIRIWCDGV